MQAVTRKDGRAAYELRAIRFSYDIFGYADGSILFEQGNTKVLCSVTLQQGVPPFLKGKKVGWLTAEYAMLPTSTQVRTQREINTLKRNGRSIEISRLISRALRAVVNLDTIGEKTITVDCDVLQADGSTRAACITASFLALEQAVAHWVATGVLKESIIIDQVAAVSAGVCQGQALLDLNYEEDSMIDADFNFVLTKSGRIIEVQGGAEKHTISWDHFEQMKEYALQGIQEIFLISAQRTESKDAPKRAGIFSLQNRLKTVGE